MMGKNKALMVVTLIALMLALTACGPGTPDLPDGTPEPSGTIDGYREYLKGLSDAEIAEWTANILMACITENHPDIMENPGKTLDCDVEYYVSGVNAGYYGQATLSSNGLKVSFNGRIKIDEFVFNTFGDFSIDTITINLGGTTFRSTGSGVGPDFFQ